MIAEGTCLGDFHRLQLFEPSLFCDFVLALVCIMLKMSDVGYVPDIADLISEMLEEFDEYVICHSRSCMSQMGVSIDRRTADIKAYMSFIYRLEQLFFS